MKPLARTPASGVIPSDPNGSTPRRPEGEQQDLTDRERSRLLQYGQQILSPVFSHLEVVAENYRKQQTALQELEKTSKSLREDIDSIEIITDTDTE